VDGEERRTVAWAAEALSAVLSSSLVAAEVALVVVRQPSPACAET